MISVERALGVDVDVEAGAEQLDAGVRDRLADEDALRHVRDGSALKASSAAVTATPRSMSAPSSASTSSTAASCVVMSKTSNQPMWPRRKILPFSSPWPFAIVIPKRSRSAPDDVAGVDARPARERRSRRRSGPRPARRARGRAPSRPRARRGRAGRAGRTQRRGPPSSRRPSATSSPRDERDGQRERRVERLLRLARPLPVEVEARRRPGRRERGLGDGGEAEPGRAS